MEHHFDEASAMRMFLYLIGLIMSTLTLPPMASAEPHCTPTKRVATSNYPGKARIPTTNNLLQPTGKAEPADGQRLILMGRVVDSRCIPIPEANVELWQNNPYGRWLLAGQVDIARASPAFAGAGRTYTGMDGRFTFITAFPGPIGKRAPYLSLRVDARNQGSISTALFFNGDVRNDKDYTYKRLSDAVRSSTTIQMRQDSSGDLIGTIDIVLPGKTKYKTY